MTPTTSVIATVIATDILISFIYIAFTSCLHQNVAADDFDEIIFPPSPPTPITPPIYEESNNSGIPSNVPFGTVEEDIITVVVFD